MSKNTNAIAVFLNLSTGVAGSYYSLNKLKAITNLELRDYTVFKYDSSNLNKCIKYSDIQFPLLTTYEANSALVSCSTSVTYYNGSPLIIYRFPKYSGSYGVSNTPESATVSIQNLRDGCTISAQDNYVYTINDSECKGSFKLLISVLSNNRILFSVWRNSSITLSASLYEHTFCINTTPYCYVNVTKKAVNNESITYRIPIYFGLKVMIPH